jgi:hypothetical protein
VLDVDQQVGAELLAQEGDVAVGPHLVADGREVDVVAAGVALVLAPDRGRLAGRLDHQEGAVEAGEQAGGEAVGPCGHVDDHVLAGTVDQVVEQQLDRAGLGVVAGHAEVVGAEGSGGEQPHPARLALQQLVEGVALDHAQQP